MNTAVVLVIAYLVGAIPTAYIAGRVLKGIDIRSVGSGNVGASNVFRAVGRTAGIVVLLLDATKGVIAVVVARILGDAGNDWLPVLAAFAAVVGHSWTIFLGLRGGKGVATAAGALFMLVPMAALFSLLLFIAIVGASRMISLGSVIAAAALPLFVVVVARFRGGMPSTPDLTLCVAVATLVLWRHRANLARIARGTENRFSFRKGGGV